MLNSKLAEAVWFYLITQNEPESTRRQISIKNVVWLFGGTNGAVGRGIHAIREGWEIGRKGGVFFLNEETEDELVAQVVENKQKGTSLTLREVEQMAVELKMANLRREGVPITPTKVNVGRGFVACLCRQNALNTIKPTRLDPTRFVVVKEVIEKFWDVLGELYLKHDYDRSFIFNMDEAGCFNSAQHHSF